MTPLWRRTILLDVAGHDRVWALSWNSTLVFVKTGPTPTKGKSTD